MNIPSEEKEITYIAKNTYSTLNQVNSNTKNVWFACHGMGYLSRYFLKYFKGLNAQKNYIIAPQAPSKYYQQPKMYVGSNWLTKDDTQLGMQSILNYFDAIFEHEIIPETSNFIVLGYSQGVSVATRYLASRKLQCNQLILHSGGIPKELKKSDFNYLSKDCNVILLYGTEDEYLTQERIDEEKKLALDLFGERLSVISFEGKHVVNVDFINQLGL